MSKTTIIAAISMLIIGLASCSKDKTTTTNNGGTDPGLGTYSFQGISHTARAATKFNQALSVQDYSGVVTPPANSSVIFYFSSFPTHSGTYRLSPGGSTPTTAGSVAVVFASSTYSSYYHGAPSVNGTADVTVDSVGKITVSIIHSINLVSQDSPSDSGYFKATVRQQ